MSTTAARLLLTPADRAGTAFLLVARGEDPRHAAHAQYLANVDFWRASVKCRGKDRMTPRGRFDSARLSDTRRDPATVAGHRDEIRALFRRATPRGRRVLLGLMQGLSVREVARGLGFTNGNPVRKVLHALGVRRERGAA